MHLFYFCGAVAVALLLLLHVSDAILIVAFISVLFSIFFEFLLEFNCLYVRNYFDALSLIKWTLMRFTRFSISCFPSLFFFFADVPRKWLCIYQHLAVWCCLRHLKPKRFQTELYISCTLQVNFIPRYAIFPKDNRLHSVISLLGKVKRKKIIQSNWK